MARIPRSIVAGIPYHIINRSNGRIPIFQSKKDYSAFESIIEQAHALYDLPILAYIVMPNHWHFVIYPKDNKSPSEFMRWLTHTHSQRYRAFTKTRGEGHLYQGRFKSFPIQTDVHLLSVLRYVERNALRAKLVSRAEEWRPSSVWRRIYGNKEQKQLISQWPVPKPSNYLTWLNESLGDDLLTLESIRESLSRSRPFGNSVWSLKIGKKLNLLQSFREPHRPKKST